jgi:hypothetical protein
MNWERGLWLLLLFTCLLVLFFSLPCLEFNCLASPRYTSSNLPNITDHPQWLSGQWGWSRPRDKTPGESLFESSPVRAAPG